MSEPRLLVPTLPPGYKLIVNSLYDSTDPACLTADLMLVELSMGMFLDVSWCPEHDPSGSYYVTIFKGDKEYGELRASTAKGALEIVESMTANDASIMAGMR